MIVVIETRGGQIQNVYSSEDSDPLLIVVDWEEEPAGQRPVLQSLHQMGPDVKEQVAAVLKRVAYEFNG